jgi:hypothetical protein
MKDIDERNKREQGLGMQTTNSPDVMAIRTTADGVAVQFWTDGAVTIGNPRAATPFVARGLLRELAWLVAGDVCLYDASEVKVLIKAARKASDCYAPHTKAAGFLGRHPSELRRLMRVFAIKKSA